MLKGLIMLKHAVSGVLQTVKRKHIALSSKCAPHVATPLAPLEEFPLLLK
jgi:hypothetical protein